MPRHYCGDCGIALSVEAHCIVCHAIVCRDCRLHGLCARCQAVLAFDEAHMHLGE